MTALYSKGQRVQWKGYPKEPNRFFWYDPQTVTILQAFRMKKKDTHRWYRCEVVQSQQDTGKVHKVSLTKVLGEDELSLLTGVTI